MKGSDFHKFFQFILILFFLDIHLYAQSTEALQRDFTELRFGMFIHFGIRTFTGDAWATPHEDTSKFNPTDLDCNQWAEAAAAAKMKFGILTTKHHDGFCLWDSKYTENDVASTPWKDGKGDVVREYVDAFRAHGLYPCLYYSIWDNTDGIGNSPITANDMEIIEGQITELLSNYGDIKMLFIDGWSWKMGHVSVPYDVIRALVKKLQPDCLLVDNTHLQCLYEIDMVHYEAGATCPADNTLPALQSELIYKNSGNSWFWDSRIPTASLMSVDEIVKNNLNYLEPKWCTFILNCPPNQEGKLDSNIVNRLTEVGQTWSPDTTRLPLPEQAPFIEYPVIPISASATSGNASYAIDGINDRYYYSVWQTSTSLPQSITIDLGKTYNDITTLNYVPKYKTVATPVTDGSIKSYKIYTSTDDINFEEILSGEWNGDTKMKVVAFAPSVCRYIKLEVSSAIDDYAAATEFEIGRENSATDIKNYQGNILPDIFKLEQNYPNPFNSNTIISFSLSETF
jgi:alpha-L-fucosidase